MTIGQECSVTVNQLASIHAESLQSFSPVSTWTGTVCEVSFQNGHDQPAMRGSTLYSWRAASQPRLRSRRRSHQSLPGEVTVGAYPCFSNRAQAARKRARAGGASSHWGWRSISVGKERRAAPFPPPW